MSPEQNDIVSGDNTAHIVDRVAPRTAFEDQGMSDESAHSALSSAQELKNPASTSQSSSSRPLWNTREGRIAAYKRMIEKKFLPEQRASFEALIRYYEDGGKVPEGEEELWAFDGQASFGIRKYTHIDQMPEGWLYKHRYCDRSKNYQLHYVPEPDEYAIADKEGRVITEDK